jgi:hypothetical protein
VADNPYITQRRRPGFPEIKDIEAILTGELTTRGDWLVANVQTRSFWPVNAQKVTFRSEEIWVLPIMNGYFPSVAMKVPNGKTKDECLGRLMRFLSNHSWVENHGITVESVTGGSLPRPMGRERKMGFSISDEFDLSYFREPTDQPALLALALMREGKGLNHPAYAFLSFYRVVEVAFPDGRQRGSWIDQHIDAIEDQRAKQAIASLRTAGV